MSTDIIHNRPKIKRKYPINKDTMALFKPLEDQHFVFDFEGMFKPSRKTWEAHARHKHKPHMRLTVSKQFLRHNGRYSIYCYIVNLYNNDSKDFATIGNEHHLAESIDNAIKLLTFKVLC